MAYCSRRSEWKGSYRHEARIQRVNSLLLVDLFRKLIKAERLGNWDLHLQSLYQIYPYFAESGHRLYLKYVDHLQRIAKASWATTWNPPALQIIQIGPSYNSSAWLLLFQVIPQFSHWAVSHEEPPFNVFLYYVFITQQGTYLILAFCI